MHKIYTLFDDAVSQIQDEGEAGVCEEVEKRPEHTSLLQTWIFTHQFLNYLCYLS